MPTEDYAQLQRTIYDLFNRGEFNQALEYVGDDAEVEVYPQGLSLRGKEGFRQMMEHHKAPWPDGTVEVISQLVGGEGVAAECLYHATHTAPLPMPDGSEVPPTGKQVHLQFCEIWRIKDGKIVSLHNYGDNVPLMVQLGLMPMPEPATA
jgi:predicted ester cyclase